MGAPGWLDVTRVRPAWTPDAPALTARAVRLLALEWREAGLLDDDGPATGSGGRSPVDLLVGMQHRVQHRGEVLSGSFGGKGAADVATTDDDAGNVDETGSAPRSAPWGVLEGVLVPIGARALIGITRSGRPIWERFAAGSVSMPAGHRPPLNRAHDQNELLGHIERLAESADGVRIWSRFVDSTTLGHDTAELVRAGTLAALSIEFKPIESAMDVETLSDGSQLVTHRRVHLHGAGVVVAPAYAAARVTRLLDRVEAGRRRERIRSAETAKLRALTA